MAWHDGKLETAVTPRLRGPETGWPNSFSVAVLDGTDLGGERWPSINDSSGLAMYVYQSREFLEVWMRTIGRARQAHPYLVTVSDYDGRPIFLVPLAVERKFNVSLLRFMDGGVTDFNAPVLAARHGLTSNEFAIAWAAILAQLPRVDAIDLQKMPPHVAGRPNPLIYLDCTHYHSNGYAIDLAGLTSQVHARSSVTRLRKKLSRSLQRLESIGPTRCFRNPRGADASRTIERLFGLKRDQYLRTFGYDAFTLPGFDQFYREMTAPGQLGRISHLSALTCGDQVVSAHLGFVGRGRFHYVLPAYDVRFKSLGPGQLLLDHLITMAGTEADYTVFDLGEGDASYKLKWATHRVPLSQHERAMTAVGRLYLETRRLRQRFAHRKTAIPATVVPGALC